MDFVEQERLRISERRLARALVAAQMGSWEFNLNDMTAVSSPYLERIFGYDSPPPRKDFDFSIGLVLPEDRPAVEQGLQDAIGGRPPAEIEYRIRRPDGQVRWLHSYCELETCADGKPRALCGLIRDVTAQKEKEERKAKREQSQQEAQRLESLGVLAGGIAHDFNNILGGIQNAAELAERKISAGAAPTDDLRTINKAVHRAAALCKLMLAYSGRGRFELKNLSLSRLIEETTPLLKLSIGLRSELRLDLDPALPAVEADSTQMQQLIINLVTNAAEAVGEVDGVVSIRTGVEKAAPERESGAQAGNRVFLEVSDTGCGMSPETQARIFDPFFTTKFIGRGLGLSAVQGIVRGHRGVIDVRSSPGAGSTFRVVFPASAGAIEDRGRDVAPAAQRTRGSGRVLLVDDDQAIRDTLAELLKMDGFKVVTAIDGGHAIDLFQADPESFDLVLMDLTMPRVDGAMAFLQMRRMRENARVILMSGYTEEETASRFKESRPHAFLMKPFNPRMMLKLVHGAIEAK